MASLLFYHFRKKSFESPKVSKHVYIKSPLNCVNYVNYRYKYPDLLFDVFWLQVKN